MFSFINSTTEQFKVGMYKEANVHGDCDSLHCSLLKCYSDPCLVKYHDSKSSTILSSSCSMHGSLIFVCENNKAYGIQFLTPHVKWLSVSLHLTELCSTPTGRIAPDLSRLCDI